MGHGHDVQALLLGRIRLRRRDEFEDHRLREDFVQALSDVPPKPAEMEQISWLNRGRPQPPP